MPRGLASKFPLIPDDTAAPEKSIFSSSGKFSKKNLNASKALFTEESLDKISKLMQGTTPCHPRVHTSWLCLLSILLPGFSIGNKSVESDVDTASLSNFWMLMVEDELFDTPSHEKKYLGFCIFSEILPCLR